MPLGMSQRQLAQSAGMTPDALSRALNGQRGLSPLEVAAIAQTLGADTHWLITGAPDPFAVTIAARHAWDARRRERINLGHEADQPTLDQVTALYRAAYPQGPQASADLPAEPVTLRKILGPAFVGSFADRVEAKLGIDVIRIPGVTTDYAVRIGPRGVIVLATQSSWFRSNWSLAHELGHLSLGHRGAHASRRGITTEERQADAFAGALLLAPHDLHALAASEDEFTVATLIWELGVSSEAARNALRRAKIEPTLEAAAALAKATPRLLRDNVPALANVEDGDPVIRREQVTSARRFPARLLSALQTQTELGAASPELLAWALDVPVDDLDFPEPDDSGAGYEAMLADRPSAADWRSLITQTTTE